MAMQQGTPPPPAQQQAGPGATTQNAVPDIVRHRGWGYPRWPLLAALCLMPFTIIGYLLEMFFETRSCTFGVLCTIDQLPGRLQIGIIWAIFGLLWLLWLPYGISHLEGSADPPGIDGFLRRISNFETVRWLLVVIGIVTLLGILLATLFQRITPPIFALAMVVVFVALCTLFWHPPVSASSNSAAGQYRNQMQRVGSYFFILRTLVPFRYLFLPRVPQVPAAEPQGAPDQTQPAGGGNPVPPQGLANPTTGHGNTVPPHLGQTNNPPSMGN